MRRDLIRGLLAGVAGTAAMTATMRLERALRPNAELPVDYDATDHVVIAAAAVLRYEPRTERGRQALFLLVHWGYGSAVAVGYRTLRRIGCDRRYSAAVFAVSCQAMAFGLFPTLGATPPPWRWRAGVLVSSLAQHAVYSLVVAGVDDLTGAAARTA